MIEAQWSRGMVALGVAGLLHRVERLALAGVPLDDDLTYDDLVHSIGWSESHRDWPALQCAEQYVVFLETSTPFRKRTAQYPWQRVSAEA